MEEKDESKQPLLDGEERRQHLTLPVRSMDSHDGDEDDDGWEEEEAEEGSGVLLVWLRVLPGLSTHLRTAQQILAIPLTEAVGTGFLTLVVALLSRPAVAATTDPLTVGLAVGAALAAVVYGGARVSGAHYNPAVSFCLLLLRKLTPFQALIYMGSQVGGAVGGACLARAMAAPDVLADPSTGAVTGRLALVELAFTFALCFAVLHTTLPPTQQPNSFAGYAICATVAVGASLTAVMNPAVSTGLFVAAHASEGLWARWLLPLLGSLLAASLFFLTCPDAETVLLPPTSTTTTGGPVVASEQELAYARNVARASRLVGCYAMEFVGTFLLTLTVALSLCEDNGPPAPAAAGLMLSALVYTCGYLSGAHLNASVTLGVLLYRPRIKELPKAAGYVCMQVLGALIAAASVYSALGHAACVDALPVPQGEHTWGQALGAEAAGTALLILTVLLLAAAGAQGSQFFGIAIGAALTGALYAVGSISGGGLNPAAASALYITNAASDQVQHVWIYWGGPCFGAVVAVVLAELISPVSGGALDHLEDAAAEALAAEEEGESVAAGKEAAGDVVDGVAGVGGGSRPSPFRAQ